MAEVNGKAFLLEMCMGCLESDCELNERRTNEDVDYANLANVCFPELQVSNISFPLFVLLVIDT